MMDLRSLLVVSATFIALSSLWVIHCTALEIKYSTFNICEHHNSSQDLRPSVECINHPPCHYCVAILDHNAVYRVSDIMLEKGQKWQIDADHILTDPEHKNTFLYDVLKTNGIRYDVESDAKTEKLAQKASGIKNIAELKRVIDRRHDEVLTEADKAIMNDKSAVIVYLRMGDRIDGMPAKQLIEVVKTRHIEHLVLSFVMHFGEWTEADLEEVKHEREQLAKGIKPQNLHNHYHDNITYPIAEADSYYNGNNSSNSRSSRISSGSNISSSDYRAHFASASASAASRNSQRRHLLMVTGAAAGRTVSHTRKAKRTTINEPLSIEALKMLYQFSDNETVKNYNFIWHVVSAVREAVPTIKISIRSNPNPDEDLALYVTAPNFLESDHPGFEDLLKRLRTVDASNRTSRTDRFILKGSSPKDKKTLTKKKVSLPRTNNSPKPPPSITSPAVKGGGESQTTAKGGTKPRPCPTCLSARSAVKKAFPVAAPMAAPAVAPAAVVVATARARKVPVAAAAAAAGEAAAAAAAAAGATASSPTTSGVSTPIRKPVPKPPVASVRGGSLDKTRNMNMNRKRNRNSNSKSNSGSSMRYLRTNA